MSNESDNPRSLIAREFIKITLLALFVLVLVTIIGAIMAGQYAEAKDILVMVLPVLATWVGTILAYYFGREQFESANKQVSDLVYTLTSRERAGIRVGRIMRPIKDCVRLEDKDFKTMTVDEAYQIFGGKVSRMLFLKDEKVTHVIHQSKFDEYLNGNSINETMQNFISAQNAKGHFFDYEHGFLIVSATATVGTCMRKMESGIQDLIITENGGRDETALGWVSNIRLARYVAQD